MPTQLSFLTAIRDGHLHQVREVIAAIPQSESPFGQVPGTHNGRWVVLTPKPLAPAAMLMCSATTDLSANDFLALFLRTLGPKADDIWSHCAAWPGREAGAGYLLHHRVMPALAFETWDASVEKIKDALTQRNALTRFAVGTQGHSPEAPLAAYRELYR